MTIDLPVEWIDPGPTRNGTATVTFEEAKLPEGYHVRRISNIAFPAGFPRDQQEAYRKSIYHRLNTERQKVVIDDAVIR